MPSGHLRPSPQRVHSADSDAQMSTSHRCGPAGSHGSKGAIGRTRSSPHEIHAPSGRNRSRNGAATFCFLAQAWVSLGAYVS